MTRRTTLHSLVLLAACGTGSGAPTTPSPAAVASLTVPTASASPPSTVRLLDAGAEPHAPLRIAAELGLAQQIDMEMDLAMVTQVGPMPPQHVEVPTTVMVLRQEITEVAADGTFRQTFGIDSVSVPGEGEMHTTLREALAPLATLEGWIVGDPRGQVLGIDLRVADDAPAATRQSLDNMRDTFRQMLATFPEEPIGIGAEWEVVQTLTTQQLSFTQTARYRLLAREGDRIELATIIVQNAPAQDMPSPQPGMSMRLERLEGSGEGTAAMTLGGRVLGGQTRLEIRMQNTVTQGEAEPTPMRITTRVRTRLSGR